ncbi:hypothetical protein EVAR_85516_1 [Eumeta japonica]|uniref:Uncharacterized protein n=1 Tax=Eumeta variegata TaxID=151549 RepID=A0A4C1VAU9_EUMVA|nr:hypothetical protein EVAR_85516_1 [Eumeta japonica]
MRTRSDDGPSVGPSPAVLPAYAAAFESSSRIGQVKPLEPHLREQVETSSGRGGPSPSPWNAKAAGGAPSAMGSCTSNDA